MIAIVDLKMGNISSVKKALEFLGADSKITNDPKDLVAAKKIILPGVGSFTSAAKQLDAFNLKEEIHRQVTQGKKPILGICLGMQLLAETGLEGGKSHGLGLISAVVEPIVRPKTYRVPHIGWNDVKSDASPLYEGIEDKSCFYFVHSYHMTLKEEIEFATVDYGGDIVASIAKGHVFGTQFHPEKSQQIGLKLLDNFVKI